MNICQLCPLNPICKIPDLIVMYSNLGIELKLEKCELRDSFGFDPVEEDTAPSTSNGIDEDVKKWVNG